MTIVPDHEQRREVAAGEVGNPFSTRYVRPGAIPYLLASESENDAEQLVARLAVHGWRGEIVGPHGSGKSTLLATLLPLVEHSGRIVVRFEMRAGERRLRATNAQRCDWNGRTLVVVDGYEQLGWWSRRWLDLTCRRTGAGLLVMSHASVGLPSLITISPSLHVLQEVVARLLAPGDTRVTRDDVARVFNEKRGNAREALFGLYDLYELRRSSELNG